MLSAQGVSSSLLSMGNHGRFEWYSYCDKRRKYSATLIQSYIETYRKKLEEVVFIEEEFLYKKISKKDVYVDYGATADIPQDAVKQYGDLTALK